MMAALDVLRVVGDNADADFVAMDILPILWSMSLGPLLDLKQFQLFMELIKSLSRRVEDEQMKKLQELSVINGGRVATPNDDFIAFGGVSGTTFDATNGASEDDFERLVKGKAVASSSDPMNTGWDATPAAATPAVTSPPVKSPQFSWSTPSPTAPSIAPAPSQFGATKAQSSFRTVTPDLTQFGALTPSSTQFSQPLQPTTGSAAKPIMAAPQPSSINWSTTSAAATSNPWASTSVNPMSPPASSFGNVASGMSNLSLGQPRPSMSQSSSFSLPPPPASGNSTPTFSLAPPPGGPQRQSSTTSSFGQSSGSFGGMSHQPAGGMANSGMGGMNSMNRSMSSMSSMMGGGMGTPIAASQPAASQPPPQQPSRSGLDKYESLL